MLVILVVGLALGGFFDSRSQSPTLSVTAPQSPDTTTGQTSAAGGAPPTTTAQSSTNTAQGSTSTTASTTTTTSSGAAGSTTTFSGRSFSIKYPTGWAVQSSEKRFPWGTDTTIVSPSGAQTLLRVDVTPHPQASDPATSAKPVIAQVKKQPGYQLLGLGPGTLDGSPAEKWEFLVNENGVLLHKVDEFIITKTGVGVAVLTQAPADRWAAMAKGFDSLRQTISTG